MVAWYGEGLEEEIMKGNMETSEAAGCVYHLDCGIAPWLCNCIKMFQLYTLHRRRQWHPTLVLLPWKSHGTEKPRRLQSMGSRRVGHDWATSLSLFTFTHWRRKWQPTPVFLPGESQGRGILVGCHLWGRTESDTTEATQQSNLGIRKHLIHIQLYIIF